MRNCLKLLKLIFIFINFQQLGILAQKIVFEVSVHITYDQYDIEIW